jgi:hypothetical protein
MPSHPRAAGLAHTSSLFYGWRIVAVAFLCHFIATGFVFYCYGVFFRPLQDLFGWSRLTVGGGLYVISLLSAVYSPLAARIMDSAGIRRTMILGAATESRLRLAPLHPEPLALLSGPGAPRPSAPTAWARCPRTPSWRAGSSATRQGAGYHHDGSLALGLVLVLDPALVPDRLRDTSSCWRWPFSSS